MRQSNAYVIIFSLIMTIVIGGLLSGASVGLKPAQERQIELDTKKKILGAVMDISNIKDPQQILDTYDARITAIVVDFEGNLVQQDRKGNPVVAEKVNITKESKIAKEERFYPVFQMMSASNKDEVEAYIFPTYGQGLWNWISSYIALDNDLNTVLGIAFDHAQETPGLGARISSDQIQSRYNGKKIYDNGGNLVSITMVKGEGNTGLNEHEVDGMSGATMTAKGVNSMLEAYLEDYQGYIKKVQGGQKLALNQ